MAIAHRTSARRQEAPAPLAPHVITGATMAPAHAPNTAAVVVTAMKIVAIANRRRAAPIAATMTI